MEIDWKSVNRVLLVRLRSIGDTVLATPSLIALKRFLPEAEIDILLEEWVAPLLDGFENVDNILIAGKTTSQKLKTVHKLRGRKYDVVFNLHGGTTSTFLTFASGARHRVGYLGYRNSFLLNHRVSSPSEFWGREKIHSVEQQLALLGSVGILVDPPPRSSLAVTQSALTSLSSKLRGIGFDESVPFAVIHPLAAFDSKRWSKEKFAQTIAHLSSKGVNSIAVGSKNELAPLEDLRSKTSVPFWISEKINLPETTALLSKARLFVGNDSGIAHMAAAINVPSVVIFGSMDRDVWYPWTDAPAEIVFHTLPCQPCPGYECKVFGDPRCILSVPTEAVIAAIGRVMEG